MTQKNRTGRGGSYFKATPDSEPILVEGTGQKPDPRALEQAKRKSETPTDGGKK